MKDLQALNLSMTLKRGSTIRSNKSDGSGNLDQLSNEFTIGAADNERQATEELEDAVSKQFMDQADKKLKLQNQINNSNILEDDEESYVNDVEEFFEGLNNDTNENGTKPNDQSNFKSRTTNVFALKQSAYNDVRISGTSRANKIFSSIDRNQ